jgi:hypothetical protein
MNETTTDAPSTEAPPSLWEDFIDIFYAPREVFARRRNAGFGIVLLILTLLLTVLFFASQGPLGDAMAAEFRRGMERSGATAPQMTPEQAANAQRMGAIFGTLGMLIAFPIGVALIGLAVWALGKAVGSVATAGMSILIVTYAAFPKVPQMVSGLVQGLLFRPDTLAGTLLGPGRFLDPDTASPLLMALLMRVDVFYVWSTVLIAIGLQVIGKVPAAQAYLVAIAVWFVGALPAVVGAVMA